MDNRLPTRSTTTAALFTTPAPANAAAGSPAGRQASSPPQAVVEAKETAAWEDPSTGPAPGAGGARGARRGASYQVPIRALLLAGFIGATVGAMTVGVLMAPDAVTLAALVFAFLIGSPCLMGAAVGPGLVVSFLLGLLPYALLRGKANWLVVLIQVVAMGLVAAAVGFILGGFAAAEGMD